MLFGTADHQYFEEQNMLYAYALSLRSCRVRAEGILDCSLLSTMLLVCGDLGEELDVLERLFPDFRGHRRRGNDVCSDLLNIPPLFWHLTGETPETFEGLYQTTYPWIMQSRDPRLQHVGLPRRIRPTLLNPRNRLLASLIWLRQYCREELVCALFQISVATVSDEVYHIIPIIWYIIRDQIRWPNAAEWATFRNSWDSFPNALGAIDCTIHRIWRPSVRQATYYRGDKKTHFLATIVIVNTDGLPVYVRAGYVLSMRNEPT